ncbi:hypothetical protein GCM10017559_38280 [Streptosporangium longisporum]|uniref:Uncharacterized protein n=1 Tax=Streptosporangium longisporum TaxID=46187 RepID=A0ABN3Y0B5_9ACTN
MNSWGQGYGEPEYGVDEERSRSCLARTTGRRLRKIAPPAAGPAPTGRLPGFPHVKAIFEGPLKGSCRAGPPLPAAGNGPIHPPVRTTVPGQL